MLKYYCYIDGLPQLFLLLQNLSLLLQLRKYKLVVEFLFFLNIERFCFGDTFEFLVGLHSHKFELPLHLLFSLQPFCNITLSSLYSLTPFFYFPLLLFLFNLSEILDNLD